MKNLQNATIVVFVLTILLYSGVMIYQGFMVDKTPPVIHCLSEQITISVKDDVSVLLTGVMAEDDRDGDITNEVMIKNLSRLIGANTAQVTYIVFDRANNMTTLTRTVVYSDYEKPKFSMTDALNYTQEESITLLDRLAASDVLSGDISQSICVIAQNVSQEPGTYSVTVQVTNSLGDISTLPLKLVISKAGTPRMVELTDYLLYLNRGDAFDPMAYIAAVKDPQGNDLPPSAVTVDGNVNMEKDGVYHVRYTCAVQDQIYHVYLTVVVE